MSPRRRQAEPIGPAIDLLSFYRRWEQIRDKSFTFAIRSSFRSFGSHTVIQPPAKIFGEQRIGIGSNVFVGHHSWLIALDEDVDAPSRIDIGDGSKIGILCTITAARSVRLGASVLLGRNVHLSDHRHAFGDSSRPVVDQGIDKIMPVEIADGAWLGNNAVVNPGVRIGSGAVIGANSVVTHDVPDFCVAAGIPARILRRTDP